MPEESLVRPWEDLLEIVRSGDGEALSRFLEERGGGEIARALSRLDEDDTNSLLTLLDPEQAADLIEQLSDVQGAEMLGDLPADLAAAIVDEMESDDRADVLGEIHTDTAEAILLEMDPEEAADARQLMTYEADTAGGIMITEYLAYPVTQTVGDVVSDLRQKAEEYADYSVQYVYTIEEDGTLAGVVPLRDLILSPQRRPLKSVMIASPASVKVDARLDELDNFFSRRQFFGVPVIDWSGKLVGVVRRIDVEEAYTEEADRAFLRFSGIVGGDELRSMGLFSRTFRRLSWLSVNVFLNFIAASVIARYTHVLEEVILLAVFLPIISDMSGCSGNQSVAVSIRELSLGVITPRDFMRVVWKEGQVGIINGFFLGLLLVGLAVVWKGNLGVGLVAGIALALNTVLSVCLGGVIPLMLRSMKIDPAIAASPMLTTVTDMCGFFLALSLASAFLVG